MTVPARIDNMRVIRSPRGTELSAKSWLTEAPLRMLMNNLDPEVAEKPEDLIVYGGRGRRRATGSASTPSSRPWNASETNKLFLSIRQGGRGSARTPPRPEC